jgi:hypothetical protein
VRELRPGLWHWDAPHPEWTDGEPWPQTVSSYAIDDGERLLLFDPLAVPSEIEERAADRKPVIVLTAPWHERDTQSLLERLDAPVYAPVGAENSVSLQISSFAKGDQGFWHSRGLGCGRLMR